MGGSKSSPPAAVAKAPTASDIAREQVKAQVEFAPQAARAAFDIKTDPSFGLEANVAEDLRVRAAQFGGETDVQQQVLQNVLANLISPTGISAEQQAAVTGRRETAQSELQTALRERANLGGGLFGGRAGRTEERAVSDLQARFAEEDINREAQQRQLSQQNALQTLQLLFPGVNLAQLQFTDPVASPESSLAGALQGRGQDVSVRGQDIQQQISNQQTQNALLSSLFSSVGTAAGGALGVGGIFGQKVTE